MSEPLLGIVLGTMSFGDTVEEETARAIVEAATAAGVTELDTANTYAGGRSEQIIGRVLADGGHGHLTVSSKVGMQPSVGPDHGPLSRAAIVTNAQASCEHVGRALDTLYLHQPDRRTHLEETLGGVAEVLERGMAARFGLSNYSAWETVEVLELCRRLDLPAPRRAQQLYNPLARRLEIEFLPFAQAREIDTIVYNPLAGGLLTGRYRRDQEPQSGRFANSSLASMYRDRYWNEAQFAVVSDLHDIATRAQLPLVELSLRWLLGATGTTAVLLGASSADQLASNIDAINRGPLLPEIQDEIETASAPLLTTAPHYAR